MSKVHVLPILDPTGEMVFDTMNPASRLTSLNEKRLVFVNTGWVLQEHDNTSIIFDTIRECLITQYGIKELISVRDDFLDIQRGVEQLVSEIVSQNFDGGLIGLCEGGGAMVLNTVRVASGLEKKRLPIVILSTLGFASFVAFQLRKYAPYLPICTVRDDIGLLDRDQVRKEVLGTIASIVDGLTLPADALKRTFSFTRWLGEL